MATTVYSACLMWPTPGRRTPQVPSSYTGTLKQAQEKLGRIDPTGCPEGGAGF